MTDHVVDHEIETAEKLKVGCYLLYFIFGVTDPLDLVFSD